MMIDLNKISCILLLMLLIGSFSVTEAFYDTVNVKIMNGDEVIELNWKRTEQYVSNKNMPIWLAEKNEQPRFALQMIRSQYDFITYHDVEKSSAVIYVPQCNCFYGVIDTRFYVYGLPLNCLQPNLHYKVGDEYIFIRKPDGNGRHFHKAQGRWLQNFFLEDEIRFINDLIDKENSISHLESPPVELCPAQHDYNMISPPAEVVEMPKPSTKVLYLEILVFITHDIYSEFNNAARLDTTNSLAMYYTIYFNAIDMLFAKLSTDDVKIRINIAGLVLETEIGVFSRISRSCTTSNRRAQNCFHNADAFLSDLPKYINEHKNIFVEDSFDLFFVATRYNLREHGRIIPGKSTPVVNVYAQKIMNRVHEQMMGLVVQEEEAQGDYVIATRQIAQLLKIIPDTTKRQSNGVTCQAIMQSGSTHCQNCLKWSEENQHQLQNFVRSSLNYCFLLNYPRSLHPYGQPMFSLNPEDQCMCYSQPKDTLNLFYIFSIPPDSCDKQLECTYLKYSMVFPLPLDGTPCGPHNKVCWRKQCVDTTQ